ncbi:MAG: hypothetical protein AAF726_07020 [Planctomycetota bacterium]
MTAGEKVGWGLVLLVTILHFDLWNWDTTEVVFGFMPVGLAWQAGISLAAAFAWALMMRVGWPSGVEDWAAQPSDLHGDTGEGHS